MTTTPNPVLEARGLRKAYQGSVALERLDFQLERGEVRALLGKNGAGKSTFVEILSGALRPDAGEIRLHGEAIELDSPHTALAQGLATVHQDLRLFNDLTVRENIAIGRGSRLGVVSHAAQAEIAERALERLSVALPLERQVGSLSTRDQQLVAIAKAISHDPDVLILDEPTSALFTDEIEHLLALVRRLAERGVATIYISHRLEEVPRVADTVTVLRDGREVETAPVADESRDRIVEMMLGRTLLEQKRLERAERARHDGAEPALAVRGLVAPPRLAGVDLEVRRGEVVGLWGRPDAGRAELLRAIFGIDRVESGTIEVGGQPLEHPTPRRAIERGVGFSPPDRKRDGLVMSESIAGNLVLASLARCGRLGVMSSSLERELGEREVERLEIKIGSLSDPMSSLSGGNQQKVVVGRWLAAGVGLLLLDEPTKGVDVEAKAALYSVLRKLADEGSSVLVAPTEVEETLLCDRVLVMFGGRVVAEYGGHVGVEEIVGASLGAAA